MHGYDKLNRITTVGGTKDADSYYEYDYRGNRKVNFEQTDFLSEESAQFRYNEQDLMYYANVGNDTVNIEYDASGYRYVKESSSSGIEYYVYDQNGRLQAIADLAVITENGIEKSVMCPVKQYIWGPDRVLAQVDIETGEIYYYLYNGHGDVVQILDRNGNIKNRYDYDVWGNFLKKEETIENHFTYFGQTYDEETGLYYLRARYYDPATGRFINEDPIRDGLNWYMYCRNNPIRYIDPTGYITEEEQEMYQNGQMAPMAYSYLMNLTYQWWLADTKEDKDKYHQLAEDFRANDYKTTKGAFPDVDKGIAYMSEIPYAPLNKEQHYFRNQLNIQFEWDDFQRLQERLPDNMKWNGDVLSNEHQNNLYNGQPNKKYVSACGSFEIIYNANNELQTGYNNWEDMGTFNYMSPIDHWFDHVIYDVLPYYRYDNVPQTARR